MWTYTATVLDIFCSWEFSGHASAVQNVIQRERSALMGPPPSALGERLRNSGLGQVMSGGKLGERGIGQRRNMSSHPPYSVRLLVPLSSFVLFC